MTIRVIVADDQQLIRNALQTSIATAEDMEIVGEAGTGADAVRLAERLCPDVVMMDLRMPGMDGIEATHRITRASASARVLVLTTFDDDESVYGALHAGAAGFLVKDMAVSDILTAIRVVATGDSLIAPSVTRRLINDAFRRPAPPPAPQRTLDAITEREQQVLLLIGSGLSNTEIAAQLSISVATAKSYVTRLLTKLNARDRVHLVIAAYEAGLVRAHQQMPQPLASGKLARRPELDKALLVAHRRGDQLVVTKLDRLGRSLEHLIELSARLQDRGVDLVVLDQSIDTSTAMGRMFFQILGSIAEFEHALMSERTLDGLAAARARGRTGGQKAKLTARQARIARDMYEETGPDGRRIHTVAHIAAEFGVTRPTIYRHLANLPKETPPSR